LYLASDTVSPGTLIDIDVEPMIIVPPIPYYKIESPVFVMVVPTTAKDVKLPKSMKR
jgi:hypothetical protein